jgi:membrane protein implicated in regulation of membrane protease activity
MRGPRTRPDLRVAARYAALQVPELLFVFALALVAEEWLGTPLWLVWAAPLAWAVKDAVMFPFLWRAYEPAGASHADLIGQIALCEERLDPAGWARLGPELWRVELAPGAPAAPRGAKLRVVGVEGLVLRVEPAD